MRKLNVTLLGLMALLVVAMVAVPAFSRLNDGSRIRPEGIPSEIYLTATYDVYKVKCEIGCEEGKCLRAGYNVPTRLTICGLTFDQEFTDYDIYIKIDDDFVKIGSKYEVVDYCKPTDALGRVVYELKIMTTNPGRTPSGLTGATLCLGAYDDCLIGSEYEQEHFDPAVLDVSLPDTGNPDIGANVILCPSPECCDTAQ